jgi:hypothetical protein
MIIANAAATAPPGIKCLVFIGSRLFRIEHALAAPAGEDIAAR